MGKTAAKSRRSRRGNVTVLSPAMSKRKFIVSVGTDHKRLETRRVEFPAEHRDKAVIAVYVITAILVAVPFLLGKYMEFNTPGPYDSASNVYSAHRILTGAKLGVEEMPSAQLGTLLMNMLGVWVCGFNETGPKVVQAIVQAAALILMFFALRRLFGTASGFVAVLLASFYLSAPMIAKFGNVKEQYMIGFMVMGVSCFIFRQLGGKWWTCMLAGAFLIWAPLFKQTGISAAAAVGLFLICQPIFGHRTWKQTGVDFVLLTAGAMAAVLPAFVWLIAVDAPPAYMPYHFIWKIFVSSQGQSGGESYVSNSRRVFSLARQYPIVFRYYGLLALPIAVAVGAIAIRFGRGILSFIGALSDGPERKYDRFVLLFAVWWLLDMGFVWISPRSYEQYYLPLVGSAAMLGGYLIAVYCDKVTAAVFKGKWIAAGLVSALVMIAMGWHVFFGIEKSPHSGQRYRQRQRGYVQHLKMATGYRNGKQGAGEKLGDYISKNSTADDTIYVWGWYPGIYIQAGRVSSSAKAFTSEMHVQSPRALADDVEELLGTFEKRMPKFIVDSRKKHFPWNRPPLELWPQYSGTFLDPCDTAALEEFDDTYSETLGRSVGKQESQRYWSMKPFRDFVMNNYRVAGTFGQHVLFELKESASSREL